MRQQLIKDRGTIDPKTDAALTALEKLTGESDSLIPELNNTKDTLVKLNATTNSILDTLEESGADITEYQTLLQNIRTSLNNLEDLMDDLDDKTGSEWLYISELQSDLSNMKKDLKNIKSDMNDLNDRIKALNDLNGSINTAMTNILTTLVKKGVITEDMAASIGQLLSAISSSTKNLLDALQSAAGNLSSASSSLSGFLDTSDPSSTISTISATYSTITRVSVRTSPPRAKS